MARRALHRCVTAAQRKDRAAVVKALRAPIDGGMAIGAIWAQAAVMGVIVLVTGDAGVWRSRVTLPRVTGHAARPEVRAHQRKPRIRVVETNLAPPLVDVTTAAPCAKATVVRFIRAMTIDASS